MFKVFKSVPRDLLGDSNSSINKKNMNFLSIDCSMSVGSLFIRAQSKTFNKILQSDKSNNDLLMQQIINFFKENDLKFDDITQIFVNQGPGNFSGLRASLSVAKGISLSKNLKLFGYNTFILSCSKFFNKKDDIFSFVNFRGKYFVRQFDYNLKSISNIKEITIEEIIKNYDNKFKVIPKNLTKYFDEKVLKLDNLRVMNLDYNELEFLSLKDLLDKGLIRPLYLS